MNKEIRNIKLWAGIVGIIVAAVLLVTSCLETAWNILTTSGHFNGITGIIIAALLLSGSIVRIAMRDGEDDSGSIISLVLFGVATGLAFVISPLYAYMRGWCGVCLVMAIVSVIMIILKNQKEQE